MADIKRDLNILTSRDEICAYLGVGKDLFNKFLALKMPVICIDSRWYGHRENIDAWWKILTSKQRPELIKNTLPNT
ncbi:MAG: hypothetical protein UY48_C0010G0023 [Candidatus Gottesmanbacteria bacterium GW2011_GWB1_49_7]|uniref:Uncharacterized protein n=1 Tax=Candidatus Gottesmanbacteria bacterium GW2011_GWB1_49_7 TaxID=1618448 RepID=A0A0G1W1R6_9BACT|nr:MAG: hypothetical protein UY48_C0010G0023 [Candidatus Gottesmanbacteria bacterium GW2011_GWB1_49_7]